MVAERIRMVCLAHAGGTASDVYAPWKSRWADTVEVIPLDLPGRGSRPHRPVSSVDALVSSLSKTVMEEVDGPWYVFGHSFGAGLALEITRFTEGLGRGPVGCLVSGRRPPAAGPPNGENGPRLSDDELLERVSAWGGLPPEFLSHTGLRRMAVERLRLDIEFSDRLHRLHDRPPVAADLHVLSGRSDPLARPEQALGWRGHGTGRVTFDDFEGDHFFVTTNAAVVPTITARLTTPTTTSGARR